MARPALALVAVLVFVVRVAAQSCRRVVARRGDLASVAAAIGTVGLLVLATLDVSESHQFAASPVGSPVAGTPSLLATVQAKQSVTAEAQTAAAGAQEAQTATAEAETAMAATNEALTATAAAQTAVANAVAVATQNAELQTALAGLATSQADAEGAAAPPGATCRRPSDDRGPRTNGDGERDSDRDADGDTDPDRHANRDADTRANADEHSRADPNSVACGRHGAVRGG